MWMLCVRIPSQFLVLPNALQGNDITDVLEETFSVTEDRFGELLVDGGSSEDVSKDTYRQSRSRTPYRGRITSLMSCHSTYCTSSASTNLNCLLDARRTSIWTIGCASSMIEVTKMLTEPSTGYGRAYAPDLRIAKLSTPFYDGHIACPS